MSIHDQEHLDRIETLERQLSYVGGQLKVAQKRVAYLEVANTRLKLLAVMTDDQKAAFARTAAKN